MVEPKSNDDDDDEEGEEEEEEEEKTPRATEFVEFYYDTNKGTDTDNKLRTVKGVHWRWFRHNEEEEEMRKISVVDNNNNNNDDDDDSTLTESHVPNSWYVRPAPAVQFSSSMKDTQTSTKDYSSGDA